MKMQRREIWAILVYFARLVFFANATQFATQTSNELVTVIVIYRHGDRTPIETYPTDPYGNESFWPPGFGQLTNLGKEQHYELGQWLRQRYSDFLPVHYDANDIYVRSTDVDRTLISALANLAGLYPPKDDKDVWNANMAWQPIPVHTIPEADDVVLAMKTECPRYDELMDQLLAEPYFKEIAAKNAPLYTYVTQNSGRHVDSIESLEFIYNTLFIEDINNCTLPQWTQKIYPTVLQPIAALSFAMACYTPEMAKLKVGPLLHEVIDKLQSAVGGRRNGSLEVREIEEGTHRRKPFIENDVHDHTPKKMWMYSAHDTTIANVLSGMQVFQPHSPPFAATVILELRTNGCQYYVNVFYKNGSKAEAELLTIPGCGSPDCELQRFAEVLAPVAISVEEWHSSCEQLSMLSVLSFDSIEGIVVFALFVLAMMAIAILVGSTYCVKRKREQQTYLRLPDDDDNRV